MTAKFIRDASVVSAVETLRDYCREYDCERCVFNTTGYCQFKNVGYAPVYWDIPNDYESDNQDQGGNNDDVKDTKANKRGKSCYDT